MSKENRINKKEHDSSDAPPPTPKFQEQETIINEINEYFTICPNVHLQLKFYQLMKIIIV